MKKTGAIVLIAAMLTGCASPVPEVQEEQSVAATVDAGSGETAGYSYPDWYSFEHEEISYAGISFLRNDFGIMPAREGKLLYYTEDYRNSPQPQSIFLYDINDRSISDNVDLSDDESLRGLEVYPFEINGDYFFEAYSMRYDDASLSDCRLFSIDFESGSYEETDISGLDNEDEDQLSVILQAFNTNYGTVTVNGSTFYSDDQDMTLKLHKTDGTVVCADIYDNIDQGCWRVNYVISLNDSIFISFAGFDGSNVLYSFDPETLCVTEDPIPRYLSPDLNAVTLEDGRSFMADSAGVYEIEDQRLTPIIDYSHSDSVAEYGLAGNLVDVIDGNIVSAGLRPGDYGNASLTISYSRQAEFPYGDRIELTVGNIGEFEYDLASKIDIFNDTNESYYVVPVYCELPGAEGFTSSSNEGSVSAATRGGEGVYDEFSNTVAINDLDDYNAYLSGLAYEEEAIVNYLNGRNAPDIMITDGNHRSIADDVPLEDMTEYLNNDESLNEDDLFMNIIEASKTGGRLFQMPVKFYINGIAVYSGDEDRIFNASGISYDQYSDLVDSRWGGSDPILEVCDILEYTEELISSQYDLFTDEISGDMNFHNASFYALLEYISGLGTGDSDITDADLTEYSEPAAEYSTIFTPWDGEYYKDYMNIESWMALPSYDMRPASACVLTDMGILSSSANKDGAWEFISFCMTCDQEDVMDYFNGGLPISKVIAREESGAYTDYQWVEDIAANATSLYVVDIDLRRICHEVIPLFIDGHITADDAADRIEDCMNGSN